MTTAYTSLLGLALPVTGELSGVWGDTVNNSITSLLDSAIAGTTTLSSDADVTLTTTTGASNTSRQAILLWTAGGTVTRNITAPAQSKIYTVINKSSSTQSIVLRGVGPTTGVTIVQGESAVCAWNGSDFIKISNTSGAGVFTTLSVSGAVTLSGGTANGVAYLNGSKVLTTGSALTFDGTNLGLGGTNNSYGSQTTMTLSGTNVSRIDFRSNSTFTGTILSYQAVTEGLRLQTEAGYPITFYPAGTKAATIDTAGNLGLGVTPSAWFSSNKTMQVGSTGALSNYTNGSNIQTFLSNNVYWNAAGTISYLTTNTATSYTQDNGTHKFYVAPSGTAGNAISFTQAMTLDANGNLGIGQTSMASDTRLHLTKTTDNCIAKIQSSYGAILQLINGGGSEVSTINATGNNVLTLQTGSTERARIDSSGNLLVGSSSTIGTGGKFQVTSSTDTALFKCTSSTTYAAIISNVENTAARLMAFQYGSGGSPTNVGTITTNGTGVTYGTSSDYRLKENIVPMTGALDKVAQLKPVTYKWKINGSDGQGFIAHELAEVVPDAVQGEKDAVDADGNPTYQGIDTSYLVATLTAAIQEQQTLITQLIARITALESA